MNRRQFLTSSLRGLILGAAISSGLGRSELVAQEPEFVELDDKLPYYTGPGSMVVDADPLGRRGYVDFDIRPTKIIVNEAWLMAFRDG